MQLGEHPELSCGDTQQASDVVVSLSWVFVAIRVAG